MSKNKSRFKLIKAITMYYMVKEMRARNEHHR